MTPDEVKATTDKVVKFVKELKGDKEVIDSALVVIVKKSEGLAEMEMFTKISARNLLKLGVMITKAAEHILEHHGEVPEEGEEIHIPGVFSNRREEDVN